MITITGKKNPFTYKHYLEMAKTGMKITIREVEYEFISEYRWFAEEFGGFFEPGVVLRRLSGRNIRGTSMVAYTFSDLETMSKNGIKITYEQM